MVCVLLAVLVMVVVTELIEQLWSSPMPCRVTTRLSNPAVWPAHVPLSLMRPNKLQPRSLALRSNPNTSMILFRPPDTSAQVPVAPVACR